MHGLQGQTVLVLDDDPQICETFSRLLRAEGFSSESAYSATAGLEIARANRLGFMVVDQRLPDMSGIEFVQTLQRESITPPFCIVSGFVTVREAVEAIRLGAVDVLEKPIDADRLVLMAKRSTENTSTLIAGTQVSSAALLCLTAPTPRSVGERWAIYVLKACRSEHDLKTLEEWSKYLGVSYTSLCETCRLLGIRPHNARDFARILRALMKASVHHCTPDVLLDISDRRTLKILLERAGMDLRLGVTSRSIDAFFVSQRLIAGDNEGLKALRTLL